MAADKSQFCSAQGMTVLLSGMSQGCRKQGVAACWPWDLGQAASPLWFLCCNTEGVPRRWGWYAQRWLALNSTKYPSLHLHITMFYSVHSVSLCRWFYFFTCLSVSLEASWGEALLLFAATPEALTMEPLNVCCMNEISEPEFKSWLYWFLCDLEQAT